MRSHAIYHVLIWSLLLIPHGFFSLDYIERIGWWFYILNMLVMDGLLLVLLYWNVLHLIPTYYKTGRYGFYFSILGISAFAYIAVVVVMEDYKIDKMHYDEPLLGTTFWHFFNVCRYCVIAFLLYNLQEKYDQKKQMDRMEVEKLNTEINYLRAQINPHFLFNTLNNLYALALEKSDKTPEVIIKLSKIMDFMLYELDGSKVPLYRDVENLENYIDLEKIRQGNQAAIVFRKKGEIADQKIEPLLMLPLVENAFKHGVNQLTEGAYLEIELEAKPGAVTLQVKNNYKWTSGRGQQRHNSIGLANLRRRLDLFYPGKYVLDVYDDRINYHVNLAVTL